MKRDRDSSGRAGDMKRQTVSGEQAAAAAPDKSVAVLYFENLSGSKDDEYFSDGMTEDIITELSSTLPLATFLLRFTHARMPVFVLSMCVAEPPFAGRAVHGCRIATRLIIGRHALTQALEVGAFLFVEVFEHRHTLG
jgi:hypothetical protein